jgi:flagellar assembly protein FliH
MWSKSGSSGMGQPAAVAAEPFVFAPPGSDKRSPAGVPQEGAREVAVPAADPALYERGLAEGEARVRAAFEKTLAGVREEICEALRQFTRQREGYFRDVEGEVVQLALSIARKILHREVQIDPLLLTGIVRVALESLNDGTHVRLRTNPQEIHFWRDYFAHTEQIRPTPELVGDASLDAGCCVLETELGSTNISLETQLKEIEQGFLDLLERRPRERE